MLLPQPPGLLPVQGNRGGAVARTYSSAHGPLTGVVAGFFGTYFFTRPQIQAAQQQVAQVQQSAAQANQAVTQASAVLRNSWISRASTMPSTATTTRPADFTADVARVQELLKLR